MAKIILILAAVILLLAVLAIAAGFIAERSFNTMAAKESAQLLATVPAAASPVTEAEIVRMPPCVQTWLRHSGVMNAPRSLAVRLRQEGKMRTAPEKPWMLFEAQQCFRIDTPAFVWKANVAVMPLIAMVARDKYEKGHGNMLIKLSSLIPIADSRGPEIDQGTMLRYLAEMTWFPSGALADYVSWENIDSLHAKATMNYGGVTASGVFAFSEDGDAVGFEAQRYGEFDGVFRMETWSITSSHHKAVNGIRIPTHSDVSWKLKSGEFHWLTLQITDIEYNVRD